MQTRRAFCVASVMLLHLMTSLAQNQTAADALFEGEAQLRAQVDPIQFMQTFNAATATGFNGGSAAFVQGANDPALFTLPGNGMSQGVVVLEPCSLWTAHYHPRANEVIIVASGQVNVAFAEEVAQVVNGTTYGGRVLSYNVPKGASVTIPQGLMHYIYNNASTCSEAQLVTVFDNKDPGTVTAVSTLFQFADPVISAATGQDIVAVDVIRSAAAKFQLIGIDQACKASCSTAAPSPQPSLLSSNGNTGSVTVSNLSAGPPAGLGAANGRR